MGSDVGVLAHTQKLHASPSARTSRRSETAPWPSQVKWAVTRAELALARSNQLRALAQAKLQLAGDQGSGEPGAADTKGEAWREAPPGPSAAVSRELEAAKATGNAAITVGKTAQQVDREHHITQKATQATKDALGASAAFNERHDVTGKVSEGVSWMANGITKALGGAKPPPRAQ